MGLEGATSIVTIRVLIAEDAFLVRTALEELLARVDGIALIGSYCDQDSLLAAVERERPDVVLTDIRMPPTRTDEGIQVARALRESHPEIGVVVLSQYNEPAYALTLLESGAARRAYLLKERVHGAGQLVTAIRAVAAGESLIDPKVVDGLVAAHRQDPIRSRLSELTPRELEVLAQLAQGKSNAAIARSLVLTKHAIERHINAIFSKLQLGDPDDVSRRVMAVLVFLTAQDSRVD
jgi:DNA-binding NarL/FixJ family response regulator